MKKKFLVLAAALLGVIFWLDFSLAADKLAYVDLGKIFSEYQKTKDYDKILASKEEAYNADREKKLAEIKQLQDKLSLLSDKEKEAKRAELENKTKELQEFDRQKTMDLRKEQDEKMREILKDIDDAIREVASKEGYSFVFNDRFLVYQAKELDITNKVVEVLAKKSASAQPAQKKR